MPGHRWAKPPPWRRRTKLLPDCNVEVWRALHPRLVPGRMMATGPAITELQDPPNDCATIPHSLDTGLTPLTDSWLSRHPVRMGEGGLRTGN